jgi:hypothetical protein
MGPGRRIAPALAPLAVTLALGLVAGAALAGVTVYKNQFSSKSQAKQFRHGDGKHCDKRWRKKSEAVLVEVKRGPGACVYRPPVAGDRDGPDHDFQARVKLLRATPKGIRRTAYLGIEVRSGKSSGYELRIFPKQHKYVVRRKPGGGGTGFPKQGKSRAVKGVDKANIVRLKAFGNTVTAKVNRRRVARVTDSNAGQVSGRKLEVFVGQKRHTRKDVIASVDNLKLQVPNP